jgi:predicted ester cyclase
MSLEKNKAAYRRVFDEAYNKGNVNAMDELYAADFVLHQPPLPDIKGLETYKGAIAYAHSVFPDLQCTIEEMVSEEDTVAVRWKYEGTHKGGKWLGIAPTGTQVAVMGCFVSHWLGGKIVEEWYYGDLLGAYHQLGAMTLPWESEG